VLREPQAKPCEPCSSHALGTLQCVVSDIGSFQIPGAGVQGAADMAPSPGSAEMAMVGNATSDSRGRRATCSAVLRSEVPETNQISIRVESPHRSDPSARVRLRDSLGTTTRGDTSRKPGTLPAANQVGRASVYLYQSLPGPTYLYLRGLAGDGETATCSKTPVSCTLSWLEPDDKLAIQALL
jgi:hypothetical protein